LAVEVTGQLVQEKAQTEAIVFLALLLVWVVVLVGPDQILQMLLVEMVGLAVAVDGVKLLLLAVPQ